MKQKVCAFTIIAKNYFAQASVLAESYTRLHPDHDFFIFYIDNQVVESPNCTSLPIKIVGNKKILNELSFKYNITEYSTAVKPQVFSWLAKKYSPKLIYYIDPDICFYKRIDHLTEVLKNHDCVLTPHRTQPTYDDLMPNEKTFMGCGYYNLGFAGFKINQQTLDFFDWWTEKLKYFAYSDIPNHLFTDQKWMDFAPCFLNTYIVHEPGYNVAYWNLHEYVNKVDPNKVVFFHFSGFSPDKNILSKHQNRFSLENISKYKELFGNYAKGLNKYKNQYDFSNYKYPYDFFDNGTEINQKIRDIYRYAVSHLKVSFNNLFKTTSKNSFFQYLTQTITVSKKISILNFFLLLNKSNKEVSLEFPIHQPYETEDIQTYLNWCFNHARSTYDIPTFFLSQQKILTPNISSRRFGPKYNLNSAEVIINLEKSKYNRNNSDFIIDVYRILLHRYPDEAGFEKNLKDLDNNQSSRDILILRTLKSQEFKLINSHTRISVFDFYFICLLIPSLFYMLIGKHLVKSNRVTAIDPNIFQENFKRIKGSVGINISGYIDTESGVGASCRGLIDALASTKIPHNINNIEQQWLRRENKKYSNQFTQEHNYQVNLICANADQTNSVIQNQFSSDYTPHKYNIGYWYWESNIFPDIYNSSFEPINEIWTATTYIQNAISSKSMKPVVCIPPSFPQIDPDKIADFDFSKYHIKFSKNDFIFLNMFDAGSFLQRKNPLALVKAFNKIASKNKHAKLLFQITELSKSEIHDEFINEIKDNKQIILIDGYVSPPEIFSLLKKCHCYISLHRAEGLGIPLINAHMMGKAVISTGFSGNTDFENNSNTFVVKYNQYLLTNNIGPYPKGTIWAEPDINHAAILMDKVCNLSKSKLDIIAKKGQQDIIEYFSPKRVGDLISKRLEIINNIL